MESRYLGTSGFQVPVLSLGTSSFGKVSRASRVIDNADVKDARQMVDICLDAGVTLFDCADVYASGVAEPILGEAIKGRRDKVFISTKATFRIGDQPNDVGSSRFHLIRAVDAALRRLQTDYIDIFQLHGFDAKTSISEVLSTLSDLVRAGKIRYTGVSNFSGWQLQKSLDHADRYDYPRYITHQVYYSLLNRDYEWELMPLGLDQNVGAMIWSPLGSGKLTGKVRRNQPPPTGGRIRKPNSGPPINEDRMFAIVETLLDLSKEIDRTVPQIALNWLLQRPTVATVLIGASNEEQLLDNLGSVGWKLTPEQVARLDAVSDVVPPYPYWHQRNFQERNPLPIGPIGA